LVLSQSPLDAGAGCAATAAAEVKVVTLPVTVRDKKGKIVRDLTKDDFTLQEDGRPQTIRSFASNADLPLTLGLLVETSSSQDKVLDAERNASRSFLEQMLVQAKDKAFLIHFDHEVELLQDLTSSKEKLQKALDLLKTPSDRERANDPNDPANSPPNQIRSMARSCMTRFPGVERIAEKAAGAKGSHHSLGRRRPRQQDVLGRRDRGRAACRHRRVHDLFRRTSPQ